MSNQVVRTKQFSKGSLKNILNELDREKGIEHRNDEIDLELSYLNYSYKDKDEGGALATFKRIIKENGCQDFVDKKGAVAFEGMVITSDTKFFEELGWVKGQPAPESVQKFFDDAYQWALGQIGYKGTDKNIISAKIHYDEKTPHLQINYVPIVDKYKKKVYEKDENGKILRNERGSGIQARDENGKIIYEDVSGVPKVGRADFWRERGGKFSYSLMQDSFHEKVGKKYNLGRGEIGSNKKHKTNHQYKAEQMKKELAEQQEQALAYEQPPKQFLETESHYENRVATEQQAIAIKQREKVVSEREKNVGLLEKKAEETRTELSKFAKSLVSREEAVSKREKTYKQQLDMEFSMRVQAEVNASRTPNMNEHINHISEQVRLHQKATENAQKRPTNAFKVER